jgi:hypothetical protein
MKQAFARRMRRSFSSFSMHRRIKSGNDENG